MMGLPLGFAQPLVLLGLLSLPVLWWLLRLIPPRPRVQKLGSEKLLLDILPKEETPARTPWWLTLLRLTLAALLIIAAAGPLWNPPLATSQASAPLALLIDDGWGAAATWDTRIRTAEDLIARAETDGRGVAIIALSEVGRDISLETPGAARVRLRQLKPKPHTLDRTEVLPAIARFLAGAPSVEVLWLSDGVDVAKGAEFITELGKLTQGKSITVVEGGVAPAHALAAADNAAGSLTVKVLRAGLKDNDIGLVRALDPKGLPLGEAPFLFKGNERETEADVRSAGRNPQRHRAARNFRRALGRRRATARQALAPPLDRRRHRLDRRYRAAAACFHLLPFARAESLRRRAARRARFARAIGRAVPQSEPADADPRRRRQCRRGARAARQMGRRGRRAGALRGPAPCGRRRRSHSGEAAPRRAHARRLALMGAAAAAHGFLAREPVQHHAGAERRDGDASGAGRAGFRSHRPHLGDARRRHAAGHRGAARQGRDRAVPCDRRHALVRPAAVGRLRRHAQAHRRARWIERKCRAARGTGGARNRAGEPRARRVRRVHAAALDGAPRGRRLQFPRDSGPSAGLLWPPGRLACREHADPDRPPHSARLRAALGAARGLSPRRAKGPARTAAS